MRHPHWRPVWVWTAVCGLTLVSVVLVEAGWLGGIASVLISFIAAIKARFIIVHYMEVNRAAKHWRFLYETWNFAATSIIVIGYVFSWRV